MVEHPSVSKCSHFSLSTNHLGSDESNMIKNLAFVRKNFGQNTVGDALEENKPIYLGCQSMHVPRARKILYLFWQKKKMIHHLLLSKKIAMA